MKPRPGARRVAMSALLALGWLLVATHVLAAVRLEGAWPDADKPVSLDVQQVSRSEAVRRLADAMGWSIVMHAPTADPVDMRVKDQPASKVLSMLLSDADYVARRDGTLIAIERAKPASTDPIPTPPAPPEAPPASAAESAKPEPSASAPPAPPAAPPPPTGLPDRVVTGGNVRVDKGETVHNVVVFGGSADVLGIATGDVTVVGGSARIHSGAHVMGDVTAVGGSLDVQDGASVDGDVGVVGGVLRRGEDARIGGEERTDVVMSKGDDGDGWLSRAISDLGEAVASAALLFVFGVILLALATQRMDKLQTELAARPMKTFALGVVGLLVFTLLAVAFTLTFIGIPLVFIALVVGVVAGYAGICAVLTVAGRALVRHKTPNPYVHLAVGCVLFMVGKALPLVGDFVWIAVTLLGVGALVATRGAGYFPARKRANAA